MTNKVYNFVVDRQDTRLDKYVSGKCPELSRTQAQKLIGEGYITVNDRATKASHKLNTGDRVNIVIPPAAPSSLSPEAIPLNIIYEDDDLLVIDKPAGLTVHPAPGHPSHTLVNAVLSYFPRLADIGDSLRPGIVHRLDKDTAGVIQVAKNSAAQDNLAEQWEPRSVAKT